MRTKRTGCLLAGLCAGLLVGQAPWAAHAREVAGVRFPDAIVVNGEPLVLNGAGTRRATIFRVKVYVAALYLREPARDGGEALRAHRPKHFVAVMKRDLSRKDSAPAFRKGIERSAGPVGAALRPEIEAFERWLPTLRSGHRLTVTFTPGVGVVVGATASPEALRGSVPFGTALLGMWLGPAAADADLRASLLRGSR